MDRIILVVLSVIFVQSKALPFEQSFYEDELEMDILTKIGVEDPTKELPIRKRDIEIPEHIQQQYDSMLHQHREKRRIITKSIRKIPGIPGHVVFANASRQMFNFRLDGSVPADSDIVLAEMKIYQDRANDVVFYHSLNHTHRHRLPTSARVSLHHVTNKDGVREASLADERMVSVNGTGWKVFDITETIEQWTSDPTPEIDIELTVNPIRNSRHAQRIADKVRFVTEEGPNVPPYGYPILTVYTVKYMPNLEPEPVECDETPTGSSGTQRCCRSSRYVDFRNMRWANRWVIEPSGYEAYDCLGTCSHHRSYRDILGNLFNPSGGNSHRKYGSKYRTCGISKSGSLPMMYMVENNGVMELKVEEIPNMIAEECSCMQ